MFPKYFTYSLPNYFATDAVEGGTVDIYNVRVKDGMGTVDTRNAGIYEVVIIASDKFGNENFILSRQNGYFVD